MLELGGGREGCGRVLALERALEAGVCMPLDSHERMFARTSPSRNA